MRVFDYEVRKLNFSRQHILEDLILLRKKVMPDLVLMPSLHDVHQTMPLSRKRGLGI